MEAAKKLSIPVIRPTTYEDIGRIAYLVLRWKSELPEWLQMVEGGAPHAQKIAEVITTSPQFVCRALEIDGKVVGGICLNLGANIFVLKPRGQLTMWYVEPEYRGGLHGLRLLKEAMQVAKELDLAWLEVYPWADDRGAYRVLERLGFHDSYDVLIKRI